MNKKNKFFENTNNKLNKQPYYEQINNNNCIQNTLKDNYNSKNKLSLELTTNLDPYNYDVNYENKIKKDLKGEESFIYYSPYDQGPGRGFGNLNINNMIRKSQSSRNDTEDFKLYRESEIIDRFDYLDNRFSNPHNLVFPFPRSGQNTRKNSEKLLEKSQNMNDYQFNNPNKIKVSNEYNMAESNEYNMAESNEYNIIEPNNLPNKQLADSIIYANNQQRIRQQIYKQKINELQNKIDQLKIKYGSNLTREIIIKETGLKHDPKVDDFLQMKLDNVQPFNNQRYYQTNNQNDYRNNYQNNNQNNNQSNNIFETIKITKPNTYSEPSINYSNEASLNYSNEASLNYSNESSINY